MDPESEEARGRRLLRFWGWILGGFCALLTLHPVGETDPFWRLAQGRAVLRHGARVIPEFSAFPDFSDPVVVPQWLWDVGTWLLYQLGGWTLLGVFVALLTFAVAVVVVRLVGERGGWRAPGAGVFVSTLTVCIVMARMRLRPQAIAMLLIPGFLLLSYRYREARERRRWALGAALVGTQLLWAQLHGSFVLAPVLFVIVVGPSLWRERRRERPGDLALGLLLAAGWLTSAHGLDIAAYIGSHSSGYATHYINEMSPPTWGTFNPAQNLYGPLYLVMWLAAGAGMLRARRLWWSELLLALFGFVLGLTALRFFAIGALLLAPLTARALAAAFAPRDGAPLRGGGVALLWAASVTLLALVAHDFWERRGPIGRLGPAEGHHPVKAARYLGEHSEGWNVLSDYDVSGQLGFWLDGAARTYVDSRTPAYFDDADFGLALEIWREPGALARGIARYDVRAVVTDRNRGACGLLGPDWVPVVIEPRLTTFVPRESAPGLERLAPCGPFYLTASACEDDARALESEIERMAALGETPFVDFLRAARVIQCGVESGDPLAGLPAAGEARAYAAARRRLLARHALSRGEDAEALDWVAEDVMSGDHAAYSTVASLLTSSRKVSRERKREVLGELVRKLDEQTPPSLRVQLARVCVGLGDYECARFHAQRAAARGNRNVTGVLRLLERSHPSPRVRADMQRWLEILAETP